jgi:hypothetical protein
MPLPTPLQINHLNSFLQGYNPDDSKTLVSGFTHGFSLHFNGSFINQNEGTNLTSALAHQNVVTQKLSKELVAGRIAGPFHAMPFHPFSSFPLGSRA